MSKCDDVINGNLRKRDANECQEGRRGDDIEENLKYADARRPVGDQPIEDVVGAVVVAIWPTIGRRLDTRRKEKVFLFVEINWIEKNSMLIE